ncbi:hypothetical protein [Planctomicrobium sp. SH527]|uniref:hypothetical protein n=1 Tax=Planctomicrobium sp. SH527 TaxID=3448123 RepID=UPI003F5BC830
MVRSCIRILMTGFCFSSLMTVSRAAEQTFPYQAVVVKDQAEVRCGPGTQFYPTSLAKLNENVTVHRHDHGGWYMISPPTGSFSLIEADSVQRVGGDRGVVNVSPGSGNRGRAVVRIGSRLTDDHAFYGRQLANGDEVRILGEKQIHSPRGLVNMLMIAPPAQEFRWIKGEGLVPVSQQVQQQMASDPYQVPPRHRQRLAAEGRGPIDTPVVPAVDRTMLADANDGPRLQVAERQSLGTLDAPTRAYQVESESSMMTVQSKPIRSSQAEFVRMDEIDRAYDEVMKRDPREWELSGIIRDYQELIGRAPANVAYLARQRLEVAEKRQQIAEHYRSFVRVSAETAQRDAELLAQQASFQTGSPEQGAMMDGQPFYGQSFGAQGMGAPGMGAQGMAGQFMEGQQFDGQMMEGQSFETQGMEFQGMNGQMLPSPDAKGAPQMRGATPSEFVMEPQPTSSVSLSPTGGQVSGPGAHMGPTQLGPTQLGPTQLGPTLPGMQGIQTMSGTQAMGGPQAAPQGDAPALNGAGVLHRMQGPANFPNYALVTPDGRLLAYVTPNQGVAIDSWLGKPVGIVGQRGHDPSLGKDHIHATKIVAVQLSP